MSNACKILEQDPNLRGIVWFDEFLARLMTTLNSETPREWTDGDTLMVQRYMQESCGVARFGRDNVQDAIKHVANQDRRNCVLDAISFTVWDQVPRIERFFIDIFRTDDNAYTRAVGSNFWKSLVARIVKPGCKVDNMVVLEGKQGTYKSTALGIIGGAYYAEQHESATNAKAFAEVLQGKLVIEVSEMDAFTRAEVTRVKQVISCQSDRFRASYERHAADHPRQGIMVGSTNKDDWNRDETGARRFWPIACKGHADTSRLAAERDQLFAEALARVRAGEPWHEVPDAEAQAEQDKRYDADPWFEAIEHWLIGKREATTMSVLTSCLNLAVNEVDRARHMRVAGVFRKLGWEKTTQRVSGKLAKVWVAQGDVYGQMELNVTTSGEYSGDSAVGGNKGGNIENDIPFN